MFYLLIFPAICIVITMGLVVALAIDAAKRARRPHSKGSRDRLLTHSELRLFQALQSLAPDSVAICPKVCLYDVVEFDSFERLHRETGLEHFKSAHLDFVLMEIDSSSILAVVEVVKDRPVIKDRQEIIAKALGEGEIPLIRISAEEPFDLSEIERIIPVEPTQAAA